MLNTPKRKPKNKKKFTAWLKRKGHKNIPTGNIVETATKLHEQKIVEVDDIEESVRCK